MMRVGITGGIGSGKSTVCRLFAERGVAVYDSDREAKRLMAGVLRPAIEARFGADVYSGDRLDRRRLASIAFGSPQALADLNAIVHPAVRRDFEEWAERQSGAYVVLESALLFESGCAGSVDCTVAVLAPAEERVRRVRARDGASEEEVRQRMAAQMDDDELSARADHTIVNIDRAGLEESVARLDRMFREYAGEKRP